MWLTLHSLEESRRYEKHHNEGDDYSDAGFYPIDVDEPMTDHL